jgi:Na+(H+)/acetate symporter ActP
MAVPLDRIIAEARKVRIAAVLLALVLAPLYAVGWLVGKTLLAVAFLGVAVKVGWQDARGPRR